MNRRTAAIVWTHQTASGAMLAEGALPNVRLEPSASMGRRLIARLADELERLAPMGNERLLRCAREAADQGVEIVEMLMELQDALAKVAQCHGLLFGVKGGCVGFWREG